ncbi:MAG: recombination regulator RecX [Actinomycetota bacterium]|nr:recombination regulator RecX [Actinomycetota bacterium]MDQ2955659.1 recombination regulator RecX [Actinomycetota bacterium]
MRARTRSELATALAAKNVPDDAANRVLDRLSKVGLVDDAAFAASFVQSRRQERGLATRELSRQLRGKGVEESIVAEVVADLDPVHEVETARRLVQRKLRSMSSLAPEVQTRRLAGMLARKGYPPGIAFQVIRDVIGGELPESDDADTAWLA